MGIMRRTTVRSSASFFGAAAVSLLESLSIAWVVS